MRPANHKGKMTHGSLYSGRGPDYINVILFESNKSTHACAIFPTNIGRASFNTSAKISARVIFSILYDLLVRSVRE